MNAALGALAFLGLLCGAGLCLAKLLQDDAQSISLGRAWLLGCAALSLALHIPLAVDGQILHRSFALAAAACLGASVWLIINWWNRDRSLRWGGWIADLPGAGRIGLFAAMTLVAAYACSPNYRATTPVPPLALKARILYDTGDVTGEDFGDVAAVELQSCVSVAGAPARSPNVLVSRNRSIARPAFTVRGLCAGSGVDLRGGNPTVCSRQRGCLVGTLAAADADDDRVFRGAGLSGSADLPLCRLCLRRHTRPVSFYQRAAGDAPLLPACCLAHAVMTKQEGLLWSASEASRRSPYLSAEKPRRGRPAAPAIPGGAILFAAVGLHVLRTGPCRRPPIILRLRRPSPIRTGSSKLPIGHRKSPSTRWANCCERNVGGCCGPASLARCCCCEEALCRWKQSVGAL